MDRSLLAALALIALAIGLAVRRADVPDAPAAPTRERPVTARPTPAPTSPPSPARHLDPDRLQALFERHGTPEPERAAALELASELRQAIRHGLDPEGPDARGYREAIELLVGIRY